ncbi:MAG: HlyD family efflux transporter periplasmic adaptor subunit [Xanthomonadaceae bacterium]|nr:HlyD family efflux transporter periplasmic adaptor subunit [Xanthomonadaceae bacterium]MDP2184912.1 HlyD family efflux transporter periplasmic adaptor subunit [Xanthomonadales bacterium]MDZ4116919.1 HlyD family efflux transporter periplasmic adaptor subunit [Xanthomonadaceae bacterium]MDZ4378114.1 HlyD family efflux transporter periplasmic adaptor subunit [Xanthomonadaceae bacterium]
MKRIAMWAVPVVIVLALVWGFASPARSMKLAEVVRAPYVEGFEEEGRTRLRERYLIASPVIGVVQRIALEHGDSVQVGQVLATVMPSVSVLLDPGRRAQAQAELRATVAASEAALQRLREAQAARELAVSEHARLRDLATRGAVSESALDAVAAQAAQAQAGERAARAERMAAQQREAAARALLAQEGKGGGESIALQAPINGVVMRRYVESSVPVASGQSLLELGNPGQIEIEVEALSTDAVKLRPGMAAKVLRWGGDGELSAQVARIEPGGFTKVSALGVEEQRTKVILQFVGERSQWAALGDAYRVEVAFVLRAEEAALVVPASAVFRQGSGWAVYAEVDGRARLREIAVRGFGARQVEVASGLKVGERVVVFPDDQLHDGSRLRATE